MAYKSLFSKSDRLLGFFVYIIYNFSLDFEFASRADYGIKLFLNTL